MAHSRAPHPSTLIALHLFACALVPFPAHADEDAATPRQLTDLTASIPPAALDWHAPPHADADFNDRGLVFFVEDFEAGFSAGSTLHNQHGWFVGAHGSLNSVADALVLGSGLAGFDDASVRVTCADPLGDVRCASPVFAANGSQIGLDARCSPLFACYQGVEFIDDSAQALVTRVLFAPGGAVLVLQVDEFGQPLYHFAVGSWPTNTTFRVGLRFIGDGVDRIAVLIDGLPAFTGLNCVATLREQGEIFVAPVGVTSIGPAVFADTSLDFPSGSAWYDNIGPVVTCPADTNGDGITNTADLGAVLADFGEPLVGPSDVNGDGVVNTADLGYVISAFGRVCD